MKLTNHNCKQVFFEKLNKHIIHIMSKNMEWCPHQKCPESHNVQKKGSTVPHQMNEVHGQVALGINVYKTLK